MSDQFGLVGISNDDIEGLLFARDGATGFDYGTVADTVVGDLCDSHIDIKRSLGLKRCEIDYNLKRTTFDNEYPGGEGAPFFGTPGAINVAETDYPTNRVYAEDEFEFVNLCFKSCLLTNGDPIAERWAASALGCLSWRPMLFLGDTGRDAPFGGYMPSGWHSAGSQRLVLGFPGNSFAIDVDDHFDASMIRTRTYGMLAALPFIPITFGGNRFNDVADYYGRDDIRWTFATVPDRDAAGPYINPWEIGSVALITSVLNGGSRLVSIDRPDIGGTAVWTGFSVPVIQAGRRITSPGNVVTITTPGASTYTRTDPGPPSVDYVGEHRDQITINRHSIRFWRS
jgi:hypothetical protein